MPLTDNHRLAIRIDNLLRESQHEDGHFIKTKRIVWRILTSTDDPQLQILHQVVLDWIELLGNQGFPLEAFNPQSSADIIVRWKRATPRQPIWELIREMLVEYADYLRRTPYDADMKQLEFISRLQELIGEHLSKGDGLDEKEAFYQVVEALETSHEITTLRLALGQDPSRFGDRTPLASASNTG